MSLLGSRLLTVHRALSDAGLPHAFGGAIALAYCTRDPRGTSDIDVNVLVSSTRAERVLSSLPPSVTHTAQDQADLAEDGQVRVWWESTPVDIFLNTHEFHESLSREIRLVPFEGERIPILSCWALAVFKAMFNRSKDWVDIEEMVGVNAVDPTRVAAQVAEILGPDPRVTRLVALAEGGGAQDPG